jgi:hypothetical protein
MKCVSCEAENDAVTLPGIDRVETCRNSPPPIEVELTPRLKVAPDNPAEARMPDHEPAVVGSVPPYFWVSCATLPPPRTTLCEQAARCSRPGLALSLPCGLGHLGECG